MVTGYSLGYALSGNITCHLKTSEATGRWCWWLSESVSGTRESVSCDVIMVPEVIELVDLETGREQVKFAGYQSGLVFHEN